jgi:integrase
VDDWLKDQAAGGKAAKTVSTLREILTPLTDQIGSVLLRDLKAAEIHKALVKLAETRSTRTIRDTRAALKRAITFAQARDLVGRNVAALVKAPPGKRGGRPSCALNLAQTQAVIKAAGDSSIGAYIILSLLTGVRTEEARALLWSHVVAWDEDSASWLPVTEAGWDGEQFAVYVWRSVRAGGDTKTPKSRRTLALPLIVVKALQQHQEEQDKQRAAAAELWQENGLVFSSSLGTALDAGPFANRLRGGRPYGADPAHRADSRIGCAEPRARYFHGGQARSDSHGDHGHGDRQGDRPRPGLIRWTRAERVLQHRGDCREVHELPGIHAEHCQGDAVRGRRLG